MSCEGKSRLLVGRFEPSSSALLAIVRRLIDDSMLEEIAQADYGDDAEEHFAALKQFQVSGELPPVAWAPMEVLELMKWSKPDDPSWGPGSTGERGHRLRAFCCALLLRMGAEPENHELALFEGENSTLIQLVESAIEMGGEIVDAALRFTCWRLLNLDPSDCEYPFFVLAVLLLVVHRGNIDDEGLIDLANWVVSAESRIRNNSNPLLLGDSNLWLFGCTPYDLKKNTWKRVTKAIILDTAHNGLSPDAQHSINILAQKVMGS